MKFNFNHPEQGEKFLTDEEIQTILNFLENGKKYSSRGRMGVALSYSEGIYKVHYLEDFDEELVSYENKEKFIEFLKNLDIHSYFGYWANIANPIYWLKKN